MDVVFEGDDKIGTDAVRQLRDDGVLSQPVIYFSGRTDAGARIAAVSAGCDAYLQKPVSLARFEEAILSILDEQVFYPSNDSVC